MNLIKSRGLFYTTIRNSTKSAAPGIMGLGKSKKKAGGGAITEKVELDVETDPEKLVNYVCGSNFYTTGEDVKIKPDSEYPDWLWTMRIGPKPTLAELDPKTKEYWLEVRRLAYVRHNVLAKFRKF